MTRYQLSFTIESDADPSSLLAHLQDAAQDLAHETGSICHPGLSQVLYLVRSARASTRESPRTDQEHHDERLAFAAKCDDGGDQ